MEQPIKTLDDEQLCGQIANPSGLTPEEFAYKTGELVRRYRRLKGYFAKTLGIVDEVSKLDIMDEIDGDYDACETSFFVKCVEELKEKAWHVLIDVTD